MEDGIFIVVEELIRVGKVIGYFKFTFLSLIPKKGSLDYFNDFRPIFMQLNTHNYLKG